MRRLLLFVFIVVLPAVIVGVSNFHIFPDAAWAATIMLALTVGVSAVFTWLSGDATPKIARYCVCADFVIALILCLNLAAHWILAREVSAAKQGVVERHAEEDRQDRRDAERLERELALKKADIELEAAKAKANAAEARKLAQLPLSQRRAAQSTARPEPTKAPLIAPMSLVPEGSAVAAVSAPATSAPRKTPDQVRDSWWWMLTALALAEVFASVLAGAILLGIWEWDRNHDGIDDAKQNLQAVPGK
jgi:hypothetical protein